MAYTLDNLRTDIRNYTEVSSTVLSDSVLGTIIKNAENKITRAIDTDQNVFSEDHQRAAGSIVRFRGPPVVTSAGPGGADEADLKNLQSFGNIPTFDNVSDLNNTNGFTIALGQIDSAGNVTGATTTDSLTTPINYFYITSTSNAATGNIQGGGANCSAGPVTLEVVNG